MITLQVQRFRDRTAFIRCSEQTGVLIRLAVQVPDEFVMVGPSVLGMFTYEKETLQQYVDEYLNSEIINIVEI